MTEQIRVQSPTAADLAWRMAYRLGFHLARLWWRLRSPCREGALVAVCIGPAVLVVRASYRTEWNLPGGGVNRGEAPETAARRELKEELGLTQVTMRPAGRWEGIWDGCRQRVHFFEAQLDRLPPLHLDNREIVEARLLTLEALSGLALTGAAAACLADLRSKRGAPQVDAGPPH